MTGKPMLPEVREYFDTLHKARQGYRKAVREIHNRGLDPYSRQSCDAIDEAGRQSRLTQKEAWDRLRESSHPQVAWITGHAWTQREAAHAVLQILPVTADELDELAMEEGWCADYWHYRGLMGDAGVLPGAKPRTPAHRNLQEWISENTELDHHDSRELADLISELIAERLA